MVAFRRVHFEFWLLEQHESSRIFAKSGAMPFQPTILIVGAERRRRYGTVLTVFLRQAKRL